ncbi:LLM class F420-dependent oxidoreductase [Streptomyces hoynatensis]|uniref:LLM class F420-dependent oxidoreductase n=1 Tax=Streptomyces hoynatensis TaxID=1141874 RepID=A0A3A9Z030_9ACTN|nr:LLM class F420-dependent oxidoreductase [Streptomyces hoynatensis]RKN41658.1 LLM class F420-dependent oxidoreductase [Streptomyces hoynatensis]
MELGLHVQNFTWPGGPRQLGPTLAKVARTAEAGGFSRLTVMDHLWQIGILGPPEQEMLEGYTALGFLAAHTERVLLHTLVTGVVYRHPGLLAKAVTTLDVLSGGRAGLGIGAAWNDAEAIGLGLPFPPLAERFERLEETLRICRQMWSGSEEPFEGAHYRLGRTLNSPQSLSRPHPKIMIGGSGERKTLRLVARYADACNIFHTAETPRKLDALREHCAREGRDYAEIEKTTVLRLGPGAKANEVLAELRAAHELGFTAVYLTTLAEQDPFPALEMCATEVIPEISSW